MGALMREFENLRDSTSNISWCKKVWWENDSLSLNDWILIDSWYRSRCLELPVSGESMVPCLDMANHTASPNSYYEKAGYGDVVLLLRPEKKVDTGEEITISYGSAKSAAEMIFSYGFIDEMHSENSLVLNLRPYPDDPLGRAKEAAFIGLQTIHISVQDDAVVWSSPFLCFMCLNEEDGLEFKVAQETDGSLGQLQVFWQGKDVTSSTNEFQQHIVGHTLHDVFKLRAVALLQDRLGEQIELLCASDEEATALQSETLNPVDETLWMIASQLRTIEAKILQAAYEELESQVSGISTSWRSLVLLLTHIQKSTLIASPAVVQYLGSMGGVNDADPKQDTAEAANDDFS
jgi:hypothetical protein